MVFVSVTRVGPQLLRPTRVTKGISRRRDQAVRTVPRGHRTVLPRDGLYPETLVGGRLSLPCPHPDNGVQIAG